MNFKTWFVRAATAIVLPALVVIAACSEDEPKVDPVTVKFGTAASTVNENAGTAQTINVQLSSAAKKDGTVRVTITSAAAYGTAYATNPAGAGGSFDLAITKGQTNAQFTITPVNNAAIDGDKTVAFTLAEPTAGFVLADPKTHTVTITDDEGPTTANFAVGSGTVAEANTEGINVVIALSSAADVAGTIEVTYAPLTDVFTSTPAVANEKITIPVAVGATSVSFTITPEDNPATEDHVVTFTIANTTGGVIKGTNLTYALTIEDDDAIELVTIAEVRAMFTGALAKITTPIKIEGVVISSNNNTTARNAWVHDGTAGLLLRFNANNTFVLGDKIEVLLKDATLQVFNGTMQIGNNDLPNDKATKVGTGALPAYKTITVAELKSDAFEGELVEIVDASFVAANGIRNFTYNTGNNEFIAGGETAVFRVENYADFRTTLIPYGTGTLRGIASEFTTTSTIFQITPQTTSDFFANNPPATLTVDPATLDFGDVQNGEDADDQFTVSGTGLTEDVAVAVSGNYYEVSLDGTTYGTSVAVPFASANSGAVTVYVKFTPASGADQTLTGSILISSMGAIARTVALTGEEKGNGASAHETLALWTFEVSQPTTAGSHVAEEGIKKDNANALGLHASGSTVYSSPAGNGSARSFSSNFWADGDYYQFSLNSTGYSDIKISWDQMGSNTGPASFVLQYSTDGTNFTQFGDPYAVINDAWSAGTVKTTSSYSVDLSSVTALNNSATLVFRLVVAPGSLAINGSAIATGGTGRVDNVKIEGR